MIDKYEVNMKNPFPKEIYLERTNYRETDIRGDFFRDQTAIIHSEAFRRLKRKTQVFFAPQNDHICTRIEHVLHVATIAATICKGLNQYSWDLDIDMAYCIGLGHDLGHTPFGHAGEYALNDILGCNNAFVHEINSYRQVEFLANMGAGLNLCYGVKDGIICHNGEKDEQYLKPSLELKDLNKVVNRQVIPNSYEACIMRFADKIAYLGRDLEDALLVGFISNSDIPENVRNTIGDRNDAIINNLVLDMIENSKDIDVIGFSDKIYESLTNLKYFNYKHIYEHKTLLEYNRFCKNIVVKLFDYISELLDKNKYDIEKISLSKNKLDRDFGEYIEKMRWFYMKNRESDLQIVIDFISGMTDNYALNSYEQITNEKPKFNF